MDGFYHVPSIASAGNQTGTTGVTHTRGSDHDRTVPTGIIE